MLSPSVLAAPRLERLLPAFPAIVEWPGPRGRVPRAPAGAAEPGCLARSGFAGTDDGHIHRLAAVQQLDLDHLGPGRHAERYGDAVPAGSGDRQPGRAAKHCHARLACRLATRGHGVTAPGHGLATRRGVTAGGPRRLR